MLEPPLCAATRQVLAATQPWHCWVLRASNQHRICSTPDSRHAAEGPAELRSVPLADSCGAAKRPSQIGSISIALWELASARSHDLTLLTKQRESLASYIDRERLRDRGSRT